MTVVDNQLTGLARAWALCKSVGRDVEAAAHKADFEALAALHGIAVKIEDWAKDVVHEAPAVETATVDLSQVAERADQSDAAKVAEDATKDVAKVAEVAGDVAGVAEAV